jgi:hypothetical protein
MRKKVVDIRKWFAYNSKTRNPFACFMVAPGHLFVNRTKGLVFWKIPEKRDLYGIFIRWNHIKDLIFLAEGKL